MSTGFDAGAKNIEVVINTAELSFTVKDDGNGICPNDLSQIATLHFTSKLRSINELKDIKTFGFRGQALHSIGSISTLLIISKTPEYSSSFHTSINNSKRLFEPKFLEEESKYFTNQPKYHGTIVSVKNLFSNLPVRKSQAQKISDLRVVGEIRNIVLQSSLSNQDALITVYKASNNSKDLICKIDGHGSESLQSGIISKMDAIFGISLKNHHQSLDASFQGYKVTGVIGKVPVQSKSYQFLFWNNRILTNSKLLKEINRTFFSSGFGSQQSMLVPSMSKCEVSPNKGRSPTKSASSVGSPYSKYPVFVIVIEGPMSLSDQIQDPSKNVEVSKHLDIILPLVIKIMKSFLKSNNYKVDKVQTPKLKLDEKKKGKDRIRKTREKSYSRSEMGLILNSKLKMGKLKLTELSGMLETANSTGKEHPVDLTELLKLNRSASSNHQCNSYNYDPQVNTLHQDRCGTNDVNISRDSLKTCQVISQVDTKFIMVKVNEAIPKLLIIDQHACDERIKVERYLQDFIEAAQDPFHDLAIPLSDKQFDLNFSNNEIDLLQHYKEQMNIWGIRYKFKSQTLVTLTHLPDLLIPKLDSDQTFLKKCLVQYVYDIHNKTKLMSLRTDWWSSLQALPTILIDLINSKACRSAIMFGRKLTKAECEQMIRELAKCKLPCQCAHGRPSIVPLCELGSF